MKTALILLAFSLAALSVEPNYVKTTTYNVDGAGSDIVSSEYSDGLGRGIQTKLKLTATTDRVSCNYYDDVGRPFISTKSFVDNLQPQAYLPGAMTDAAIESQLEASNGGDMSAYSITRYWDDPLGRARVTLGPGDVYNLDSSKVWTFGIAITDLNVPFIDKNGVNFTAVFTAGFITSAKSEQMLDGLTDYLLGNDVFSSPKYFLTITKSPNNIYSQEIKDLFGKTRKTYARESSTADEFIPMYTYDLLGNVLTETPPVASSNPVIATQYQYNTLGQLIWKQTPDGGQFKYGYRPDGQLDYYKSYVGAGSMAETFREVHFQYDDIGRLVYEFQLLSLVPWEEVDLLYNFYDNASGLKSHAVFQCIPDYLIDQVTNLTGRLAATIMVNSDSKRTEVGELYSYDDEGRVNKKIMVIAGSTIFQETDYEYDIHGKMTAEYFYYNGDHIKKRFTFDELGRLAKVYHGVKQSGGTYTETELARYQYDAMGQLDRKRFSATTFGDYELRYYYDIRDRLRQIDLPSGKKGFTETIQYNTAGNVSQAGYSYTLPSANLYTMNYTYDDLNRLKTATPTDAAQVPSYGAAYDYDQVGRFKSKQEGDGTVNNLTGYTYYTGTNRLTNTSKNPASGQEYIYDKNGNLVVDFTKKMVIQYDWRDQPVAYRFYNDLSSAGLTADASSGTYNSATGLYDQMNNMVSAGTVQLVSTVVMLYNASGNRICKMEVQE